MDVRTFVEQARSIRRARRARSIRRASVENGSTDEYDFFHALTISYDNKHITVGTIDTAAVSDATIAGVEAGTELRERVK